MASAKWRKVGGLVLASLVLLPAATFAQVGIAGEVKDHTGGLLPGVTVGAASPALIEKVRAVVTDSQGQYKIIDLRPGTYTVTFTLSGFSTVKREGIELSGAFTATVNAELQVGALAETVTVSGQSPVVDVQNVIQQSVITSDILSAIPSSRTLWSAAAVIPGMKITGGVRGAGSGQDVGGSVADQTVTMAVHGGRQTDMQNLLEGMPYNNGQGVAVTLVFVDTGSMQEMNYQLGATSADTATGGVHVNLIPKDGGNRFAGSVFGTFANDNLQSDNTTSALLARGLGAVDKLIKVWDINTNVGGPFKQDKLWFFGSFRHWGVYEQVANMWYNKTPTAFVYTPDFSRPAIDDSWPVSGSFRLTWQATPKNKLHFYLIQGYRCACHVGVSATNSPEAAPRRVNHNSHVSQVTWSAPVTNRLLLEAGMLFHKSVFESLSQPGVAPDTVAATELSTGLNFRAASLGGPDTSNYNYKAALSYVTGSHAFKTGFDLQHGWRVLTRIQPGDISLRLLNGVPRSVTVWATPWTQSANLNAALGLYAQDQWTLKGLTLNGAIRFDHHRSSIPEQHLPAVRFLGARDFAAVDNVPNWHDLSPRLGAAYNLFGTGKTALKVSLSRYVAGEVIEFAEANNPVVTSENSASRTWTDLNGDFVPQENELGPLSPATFGQQRVTTRYADDVREGWGRRGYNWETSAGIQHELLPRVGVNAAYFRRWYGNFLATDNLAVAPSDYDQYCITVPTDPRLPNGGGNQLCGFYDINPAKFGQVNNLVTFADTYGKQIEYWHGLDLTVNARIPRGAQLSGGLSTGKSVMDRCDVQGKVDNPATEVSPSFSSVPFTTIASPSRLYCHQETPFLTQLRLLGTARLPWDLQVSATFQSVPGPEIVASYIATNRDVASSLGRNLAGGVNATATVHLIQPNTRYEERTNQFDFRLSKIVKVGRARIQGNLDLYNLLNASPILAINTRYGPAWLQPTYVLPGRLFKFSAQMDF